MTDTQVPLCNTANLSDATLLEGLLADSPSAWREFNLRYGRLIHSCIARVMNRFRSVTTPDDVDEVYSTLCLQLLARNKHRLRSFDPERGNKLGSWLGMLATHAAYDLLRARRRVPQADERDSACAVLPLAQATADDICAAREQARRLKSALRCLSEKDREFFTLYFAEGLQPEEIATRMGISIKTVYSKKHKLRARLQTALQDDAQAA